MMTRQVLIYSEDGQLTLVFTEGHTHSPLGMRQVYIYTLPDTWSYATAANLIEQWIDHHTLPG